MASLKPFTFDPPDLQIYAVTPVPDHLAVLQMERVPDRIKSFYRVNNLRRFRHDRPFHKGAKDRDNEFKVSSRSEVPISLPHTHPQTPPLSTTLPSLVLLESLDREDHPDALSPTAGYLALVRGGQEGAGESLVYKSMLPLQLHHLLPLSVNVVPLPATLTPPCPPGGGEPPGECPLSGGEQEPGAANADWPVPAQAAAQQRQPA